MSRNIHKIHDRVELYFNCYCYTCFLRLSIFNTIVSIVTALSFPLYMIQKSIILNLVTESTITSQVLESLEHAMKRGAPIIAEYLGGAVNCDAYHMTDPRSDGLGVSSCIQSSLEDAGVSPEEVLFHSLYSAYTFC